MPVFWSFGGFPDLFLAVLTGINLFFKVLI